MNRVDYTLLPKKSAMTYAYRVKQWLLFFGRLAGSWWLMLLSFQHMKSQNFGLELLSNVKSRPAYNDVWGYVDKNGHEYAIIGANNGTLIYLLDDPKRPREVAFMPGDNSVWRDIKHFGEFIYVVADQGQNGIGIINMKEAPDKITFRYWAPQITQLSNRGDTIFSGQQLTAHNLYIDERGYAYLAGSGRQVKNGIMIYDVRDGEQPQYVGYANENYCHDAIAKDGILYTSDIFAGGFSVFDVKDPKKPVLIGFSTTGRNFTHNAWISDDGTYLFTTDERATAYVESYNVANPSDIRFLSRYRPKNALSAQVIPHNVHYHQKALYISYYTDGVKIVDARVPDNLIEIAAYDTYSLTDQGYHGCWGVYPYLPSGLVIASDIESGLFVFKPDFRPAALLTGHITDAKTGRFLDGVRVQIKDDRAIPVTSFNQGKYNTGIGKAGSFEVDYYHPDYEPVTLTLPFNYGQDLLQNVALTPKVSYQVSIQIQDREGRPVPNGVLLMKDGEVSVSATVGADGRLSLPVLAGQYAIYGAKWGYKTTFQTRQIQQPGDILLILDKGYYDDFTQDLGWTVTGQVSAGAWQRTIPIGTYLRDTVVNPEKDIEGDFENNCYVTGNGYGALGDFDVDQGTTILSSPLINFNGITQPALEVYVWFGVWQGSSLPNDSMNIYLVRGQERMLLESITKTTAGWVQKKYTLPQQLGDGWTFQVTVSDLPGTGLGHLVEGGIDGFQLLDRTVGMELPEQPKTSWTVYPNPFNQHLRVEWPTNLEGPAEFSLTNLTGQVLWRQIISRNEEFLVPGNLSPGFYLGQLKHQQAVLSAVKLIKSH